MAGPFRVFDELANLFRRGRTAHHKGIGDLLEGTTRPVHAKFVCDIEFGSDIGLDIFQGNVVEGSKARQLRDETEGDPSDEKLQRGRSEVSASAHGRFVRFQTEFANAPFKMHVFQERCDGTNSGFATVRIARKAGLRLFVDLATFFHIDTVAGCFGHSAAPFKKRVAKGTQPAADRR
jgi:hypothetical protein